MSLRTAEDTSSNNAPVPPTDRQPAKPKRPAPKPVADRARETSSEPDRRPGFDRIVPVDPGAIAAEAYLLYCENGYEDGHDLEHWLEAERRVKARQPGTLPASDRDE